mmetsp:Transcript_5625/g.5825  ORF Transcript_5625/g.5825 Transcript_5625/m.5825 type:complete len:316 (+) Transcript_5625:148-1095(+)|eukprot:CAMPEP_0182428652 /NCGR_PEP_ID=MMETSP1167-20130531/23180_1 /TAXON_ID=2988 /ORGANISM="Mallomonas Sp, Strain CCMP3275" /LENGTH=315 /DNA_ID=CAMNT_0024611659 /DNA_START=56 /DNA_END=1003 /DNA_ORIENTATION=+
MSSFTGNDANFEFAKGGSLEGFSNGPPMLRKQENKVEGLAFIGLNLSRNHPGEKFANPNSITRQSQFDFNLIQDRDYNYFTSTNDDGWLVGGGETGEESCKLCNPDSAHCEIMRIGTFNESWGGVSIKTILNIMNSGGLLIPHVAILPSFVLKNNDSPPETELKFEMEPDETKEVDQWNNWQLKFIHNQLFDLFNFHGRFCPGPFHMTFVRKSAWRSAEHMRAYFSHCDEVVRTWRERGPLYLEPETESSKPGYPVNPLGKELTEPHGIYLFKDRNTPIHYFAPNFHPPYDTKEKREIISGVLSKTWDEPSLSWK